MEVKIEKARAEDRDEIIDLANYVFSHSRGVTDFPAALPKLYKREYFMDSTHYVIREDGRIKASLGAYPLEWEFQSGSGLPGRGVGMVSVHPYYRSKGYMSYLVEKAMDDMKNDGIVFSCLSGHRQRYEYFGYSPAGSLYKFTFFERNIRHVLGTRWNTDLVINPVGPEDKNFLDGIYAFHEAKISRMHRQREKIFEILSSYKSKAYAVTCGNRLEGYFVIRTYRTGEHVIGEINLQDYSRLPEVLGLYMNQSNQEPLIVNANPHEREKISTLFRFAETHSLGPAYHFSVFDFPRFTESFLKLASKQKNLADGFFVLEIDHGPRLSLTVSNGSPSLETIAVSENTGAADLCLDKLDAQQFLFSPLAREVFPVIGENVFLQNLLPLPLFYENTDAI